MAKPLRTKYPGALYHVTSQGNGWESIFLEDIDRQVFLEVLGTVVEKKMNIYLSYSDVSYLVRQPLIP